MIRGEIPEHREHIIETMHVIHSIRVRVTSEQHWQALLQTAVMVYDFEYGLQGAIVISARIVNQWSHYDDALGQLALSVIESVRVTGYFFQDMTYVYFCPPKSRWW